MKVLLALAASLLAINTANAQTVIHDSFGRPEDVFPHGLCCFNFPVFHSFYYGGPDAELYSLSIDAWLYRFVFDETSSGISYSGRYLRVDFLPNLTYDFGESLGTWTGTSFSGDTPLFFNSGTTISGNRNYFIRVIAVAPLGVQPPGTLDAGGWSYNRELSSGRVARVTVKVDEPRHLWLLGVPMLLLFMARIEKRQGVDAIGGAL